MYFIKTTIYSYYKGPLIFIGGRLNVFDKKGGPKEIVSPTIFTGSHIVSS